MTIKTFQINAIVHWSNSGFVLSLPKISRNTQHIAFKLLTDMSDITLQIKEEIKEGTAIVKFQNKV